MSDAEMIAVITGSFLVLAAAITGVFAALTARINRGGKRYEALQITVNELAQQIADQNEEMATLREQVAVFQVYVDAVDEVFSMAADDATIGSIRMKLPTKPDTKRSVPAPVTGAKTRRGKRSDQSSRYYGPDRP